MDSHNVHARAHQVPLTPSEIAAATAVLSSSGLCVATVQRRLRIGWNRAADLVMHLRGYEALPEVAKRIMPAVQGSRPGCAAS